MTKFKEGEMLKLIKTQYHPTEKLYAGDHVIVRSHLSIYVHVLDKNNHLHLILPQYLERVILKQSTQKELQHES